MKPSLFFAVAVLGLLALPAESTEGRGPDQIEIDNRTYDNLYLSRIGAPDLQTVVPKRRLGLYIVPLVGDPANEMLQFGSPAANGPVAETTFKGFNGRFAQICSLVINGMDDIRISYPAIPPPNEASASSITSMTNPVESVSADSAGPPGFRGYSGSSRGQPAYSHNTPGSQSNSSSGGSTSVLLASRGRTHSSKTNDDKKKLLTTGATGIRVHIAQPDAIVSAPDPPAPLATEGLKPAMIEMEPATLAEPSRNRISSLIVWCGIACALLGFLVHRRIIARNSSHRKASARKRSSG